MFDWCATHRYEPIAVEIQPDPVYLPAFEFPSRPAILVGSEGSGIPSAVLARCKGVATIPQFGPVACLNVGVSCSIALYEFTRTRPVHLGIEGSKYRVPRPPADPRA